MSALQDACLIPHKWTRTVLPGVCGLQLAQLTSSVHKPQPISRRSINCTHYLSPNLLRRWFQTRSACDVFPIESLIGTTLRIVFGSSDDDTVNFELLTPHPDNKCCQRNKQKQVVFYSAVWTVDEREFVFPTAAPLDGGTSRRVAEIISLYKTSDT
jgi:hypothetical protein